MGTFVTSDPALDDDARRRAKHDPDEKPQESVRQPEADKQPERSKPRRVEK